MTGYVRKDTTNNIADGNVINAADLDAEFDGVQDAFNASTGHNHDGTSGEGAPITALGPTQDVTISATLLAPKTTNTVDIGSSALKFKDLFLAGNGSIGGTLAVTGVATLTAQPILSSLTASRAVFTDGSKGLVSNAITGTGNVVMSASPTLTGTIGGASLTLSSLTSGRVTYAGTSGLLQDDADLTFDGTTLSTAGLTASGTVTLSGGTANGVAYLNGSKVVTSGSALTFDGTNFGIGAATALKPLDISFAGTSGARRFLASYDDSVITIKGANASNDPEAIRITGDNIRFNTGTSGSGSEQMRLTSTGLGIGTSSPAARLSVVTASANSTAATIGGIEYGGSKRGLTIKTYQSAGGDDCGVEFNAANGLAGYGAFKFAANTTTLATLDSSGNLGLGVTPSAWSLLKAFQIGNTSLAGYSGTGYLMTNAYFDGSVYRYTSSNYANLYTQNNSVGQHAWYTAPSGTAGNAITFTQAMTLDASGNLGVGVTSPATRLEVNGVSEGEYFRAGGGTISARSLQFSSFTVSGLSGVGHQINVPNASGVLTFATGSTERARIDSSGNFLVGTTSANAKVKIALTSSATTPIVNVASFGSGGVVSLGSIANNSEQVYLGTGDTSGSGIAAGIGFMREASGWNSALSFYTNNVTSGANGVSAITERARIDSSGNLLVGNTGPANGRIDVTSNSGGTAINVRARSGNDYGFIQFKSNDDATVWGEVYGTSSIRLYCDAGGTNGVYLTSGATSWTANSDERLKENLVPIENGLSKVCSLRSVVGNFISDETKTKKAFLIAQDVQAVLPEAVSSGVIPKSEDTTEYLGVAYTDVIPLLVAAIKEQQAIIESLKARLDAANL